MTLTLNQTATILKQHGLLREVITGSHWSMDAGDLDGADQPFAHLTYDTRKVTDGTLLFIKGNFNPSYLKNIDEQGLAAYVSKTPYPEHTNAPGFIVNDVYKAMALLSAEFFSHPERELTILGVTGTKGKTTTVYFTHAILNAFSDGKAAMFSSVDNCLDGHTYIESNLTTPESLDSLSMMRQAVDSGVRYLVMEVSSQAYMLERVYGITFAAGAFLNISPDHISPIEHPTFEDYLYCKRQIITNSQQLVLNAASDYYDLLIEDATLNHTPVITFSATPGIDARLTARPVDTEHSSYEICFDDKQLERIHLSLDGDFNYANAAAAIALALAVGVPGDSPSLSAMDTVQVPGRMESFTDTESNTLAIVDYAHNFVSMKALLDYVERKYGADNPRITLVTGSAGNKAIDRRKEIVEAAQDRIERFIFTEEDTDTEPFEQVCRDMQEAITNPQVHSDIILDRVEAITEAVNNARAHPNRLNIILMIGKGNERWIKHYNRHTRYEGDDQLIRRLFSIM